jgi:hypothetical protein
MDKNGVVASKGRRSSSVSGSVSVSGGVGHVVVKTSDRVDEVSVDVSLRWSV